MNLRHLLIHNSCYMHITQGPRLSSRVRMTFAGEFKRQSVVFMKIRLLKRLYPTRAPGFVYIYIPQY